MQWSVLYVIVLLIKEYVLFFKLKVEMHSMSKIHYNIGFIWCGEN